MGNDTQRRVQAIAATAVAALLLVGAAGCGGGSSDAGSDGGTKTTTADSSDDGGGDSGSDSGDDSGDTASGELPDPCELVPIEKASEILGGESAEPDASSNDIGMATKACSWQTQESIDNPTLDGAGHVLTLTVITNPESMSMEDFWKASKTAADEEADIEGCDEAFWIGGMLSALQDGVYLTGTAGLADDSPAAKESTTTLLETACGSV